MLYAKKDESGLISAISQNKESDEWQLVSFTDNAMREFLARNEDEELKHRILEDADADFIRVLEDIIELLINKEIFQFTELPTPVQEKLLSRRWYREHTGQKQASNLMDDNEGLI
ncbi:hypothetical protein H0A36_00600 [Endozoicomonas sp. SM1973]|uniref:Tryptophan synthase subunit beta like protein n=1 Tax=Spartinivicinus marinus TaxID=2994442 RepID=A0A853I2Q1_9GAMM|nr:hypothetical protein [Spartinivicinus marinus]MCX4026650.1 hypothetical protein [Spartinivicinus marinus]NYZ64484.1 hypothetical protein [Spartinivicinus marinus]